MAGNLLRRTHGALWGIALIVAVPWALLDRGILWDWATSDPRFAMYAALRGPTSAMQVAPNLVAAERPRAPGTLGIVFVGSSTTEFGIDTVAIERGLRERAVPADVRKAWMGSADMVGIHYLTQRIARGHPAIIMLGLSPALTQVIVSQGNTSERQYSWYQDRRTVPPDLRRFGWDQAPPASRATPLERWCSLYRLRGVLHDYGAVGIWGMRNTLPPRVWRYPKPEVAWLTTLDLDRFKAARRRYQRTRNPRDYMAAYTYFRPGLESLYYWRTIFEHARWQPPSEQWAAFDAWVALSRAHHMNPTVVILPYNPFYHAPGSGRLLTTAQDETPFIDPGRYAQWLADVERFCQARGVPLLNDFALFPAEAFYDLHHMMPWARGEYVERWVERLMTAAALEANAVASIPRNRDSSLP